ncbi:MAG: Ldh family oxidoreductase [Candidatus Latescibacteria bacterium]|nr:Ldh family oxidoreductase [Candidatus Latescibacterota bacterium]
MSESDSETRVDVEELLKLVVTIFERCGMSQADAALLTDSLVYADLCGTHSHGVLRVPEYAEKLTTQGVNPTAKPEVVREGPSFVIVDGRNAMGQIGAALAMREVIDKAAKTGIAAGAIRGSNHCGAMAYFTRMALPHDMIGIATTNALPTMAPWGGAERLLGINPIAISIPAGEMSPIVYDAAFSGSSHGKIRIYQQKGLRIPEGWVLDREGQPTTDPNAAINGLLAPIGGFKGAGLAMIMGILSSMLSGASYGTELGSIEEGPTPGEDGHFVAAIHIASFENIERFKSRVDAAIQQIHDCRLAPGFDRVYAPGELEAIRRVEYSAQGIPLNRVTLADLRKTAERLSIDGNEYAWL